MEFANFSIVGLLSEAKPVEPASEFAVSEFSALGLELR